MKKVAHTTFRNQKLFCLNCGGEQAIPYPIPVQMITAMIGAFNKMHKNCPATWKQPEADMSQSEGSRAMWWWNNGERGSSSETIWHCFMDNNRAGQINNPVDPDDFRRCYLLLKAVPEWRKDLFRLKHLSPAWSNLVDNWDKLTEMLEEQFRTKKANGMYELMQECIAHKSEE